MTSGEAAVDRAQGGVPISTATRDGTGMKQEVDRDQPVSRERRVDDRIGLYAGSTR